MVRGFPVLNKVLCRGLMEKAMSEPAHEEDNKVNQVGLGWNMF